MRRYRVTDPYLRFWFRYVERSLELVSVVGTIPRSGDAMIAAISPDGLPVDGADLTFGAADLLSAWQA